MCTCRWTNSWSNIYMYTIMKFPNPKDTWRVSGALYPNFGQTLNLIDQILAI